MEEKPKTCRACDLWDYLPFGCGKPYCYVKSQYVEVDDTACADAKVRDDNAK